MNLLYEKRRVRPLNKAQLTLSKKNSAEEWLEALENEPDYPERIEGHSEAKYLRDLVRIPRGVNRQESHLLVARNKATGQARFLTYRHKDEDRAVHYLTDNVPRLAHGLVSPGRDNLIINQGWLYPVWPNSERQLRESMSRALTNSV